MQTSRRHHPLWRARPGRCAGGSFCPRISGRQPRKCSFSLIFRGQRVFALDVNPAITHRNLLTRERVSGTHWQRWPHMDAVLDQRQLAFQLWLDEFLRRSNVVCRHRVPPPPQGVQLELL